MMDTGFNFSDLSNIRKAAKEVPSKEGFIKAMEIRRPENVTKADWSQSMSNVWEKEHQGIETSSAIQTDESAIAELDSEKTRVTPSGATRRLSGGALYTQDSDSSSITPDGTEHRRFLAGDPATGARYGYIEYAVKDNTLEIENLFIRSGHESIRKEMALDLIKQYPGYEVVWDPKSEALQGVYNEIVESNPRGKEAGLQYWDGITDVDDRLMVENQIQKAMPTLSAPERALGATLVQLRAEASGLSLQAYLDNNFQDGQIFGNVGELEGAMDGKRGAVAFDQDLKALIYAGENADFSTFAHETFHVSLREMGQVNELRSAIKEAAPTAEFTQWLNEHTAIFDNAMFENMDGPALAEIADTFDSEGALTRTQEEFAARLFEGYLADGKTSSTRLKQLFDTIAKWMAKIYQTLTHSVDLDPRITQVFDSMLDRDSPLSVQLKAEREQATVITAETQSQQEYNSISALEIDEIDGFDNLRFQENNDYKPKKTGFGYKLFEMRDGELYPLFIGAENPTPQGVWLEAENLPTKGFANRPGWHIGAEIPDAPWLKSDNGTAEGFYKSKRSNGQRVWALVEYPMDVDYQEQANLSPTKDLRDTIPTDGSYLFKEGQRGTWVVTGAIKINQILTDAEVASILQEKGYDQAAEFEKYRNAIIKRKETIAQKQLQRSSETLAQDNIQDKYRVQADKKYFEALESGDMEAAQRIVDDVAMRNGYLTESDFRMNHKAPNSQDGFSANLANLSETDLIPKDYWDHPEWYLSSQSEYESFYKIKEALDRYERNGKASVWVYRAIPSAIKEESFRNGDWVTPSREYAKVEGGLIGSSYKIIATRVPLEHLWWDVNSIGELGYDDGQSYVYRDTKNNRKLNDVIVRDHDNEIIPPSKRFNYRAWQVYFQDEINESVLEDARDFDSWQEFKSFYEAFADPDEDLDADNQWYIDAFNKAHGILSAEEQAVAVETARLKLKTEEAKDQHMRDALATDEGVKRFLDEASWMLGRMAIEDVQGDQASIDSIHNVRDLVGDDKLHPTIKANILRRVAGRAVTQSSIKRIRTIMTGEMIRYYRDVYADVMLQQDLKPQVIDERLPKIDDPGYRALEKMSISERFRAANHIEAESLKRDILSGKETFEGAAEKVIRDADLQIANLSKEIAQNEAEISSLIDKMDEKDQLRIMYYKQYQQAHALLDSEIQKLQRLTRDGRVKDGTLTSKEQLAKISSLQKKVDMLHEHVIEARKSERVKETIKRQDALAKLKAQLTEKQKQRDDARKVRAYKQKLARRIMVKPSSAINYEHAQKIYGIQSLLDPNFRLNTISDGLDGRMTFDQAREFFAGSSKDEIVDAIGQRNYERLVEQRKPLNDWSINELEELGSQVADLRAEGRQVLAAKRERQAQIARHYQESIMRTLMQTGRYQERPIVGSREEQIEQTSPKRTVRGFNLAIKPMRVKSMMLDGDSQGTAYNLLVTMMRRAKSREWVAIDQRIDPVINLMKEVGLKEDDLYKTVSVALDTSKSVDFTYSALMYAYLSQFDEQNRRAVAYGNLVTQDEKAALKHDNDLIQVVGDSRYKALIQQAEYHLKEDGKYMTVLEAVREDFNSQKERINEIAIREFNAPMRPVAEYLPIHRREFSGEDMNQQIADDIFNRNAGGLPTAVQKGFTKERINISPDHQRPVNLDLMQVWNQSVRQQEHFIAFAEYGRMLNRVFKNRGSEDLQNVISRVYGREMVNDVHNYITDIINPVRETRLKNMEKGIKVMRGNLGAAYLTWKMGSIVLQAITSPAPFLIDVNPRYLLRGYYDVYSHPIASIEMINEMSPMMKHRTMNIIIDQILEQSRQYTKNKALRTLYKSQEVGGMGLTLVDRYAVAGGWLGAYYQHIEMLMEKGMTEAEAKVQAIEWADDITLKSQPIGDATEIAPLFVTGSEFARAFTQFTTSLNVIYNNLTYDLPLAVKNKEYSRVIGTITGYALAGAILGAVSEGYDEDDDEMDKLRKWIYWSFTQATGSVPLIGDQVDAISRSLITGDKPVFFEDDFFPGMSKILKGVGHLTQANWEKALSELGQGAGYVMGLPISGGKQFIKGITEGPGAFLGR